jgi:hypothetical protein
MEHKNPGSGFVQTFADESPLAAKVFFPSRPGPVW